MARTASSKLSAQPSWLQIGAVRATRVHFIFVAAYMLSIIIFDSWNLIPHAAVAQRWTAAGMLLVVNTILWYAARFRLGGNRFYSGIVWTLIVADITFASFNVYW